MKNIWLIWLQKVLVLIKGCDILISSGIDDFLKYLREVEELHNNSIVFEEQTNDETQDILHSLELQPHNYNEVARLGIKLREIRQNRRNHKNTIQQTTPVVDWIKNNRKTINELQQLLGKVRKEEKNTQGRIFTPRTDAADIERKTKK